MTRGRVTGSDRPVGLISSAPVGALIVAGIVLVACLAGIWSRPSGLLASLWPANPILLGLFIRVPSLAAWHGWVAAAFAFCAADLLTGSTLEKTSLLTAANLAGVAVGFTFFSRLGPVDQQLGRPISINYLFVGAVLASMGSAAVGMWANVYLFDGTAMDGAEIWFTAELANYMAFLPVLLAAPSVMYFRRVGWPDALREAARPAAVPAALLAGALALGIFFPDPGVMALPIPILLWCAMRAGVFSTTVLTLISLSWTLVMVGQGVLDVPGLETDTLSMRSLQLCLAVVSMGPIAVASNFDSREKQFAALQLRADRDTMTGALNRDAVFHRFNELRSELERSGQPVAVLMIDLDHFKSINDNFGHAAGDAVLMAFSKRVRELIRSDDLFGRIGGEEFLVVLPGIWTEMAEAIAGRICEASASETVPFGESDIPFTVSVGLVHSSGSSESRDDLLASADQMLYAAKAGGRNQFRATGNRPQATGRRFLVT